MSLSLSLLLKKKRNRGKGETAAQISCSRRAMQNTFISTYQSFAIFSAEEVTPLEDSQVYSIFSVPGCFQGDP